MLFSREQWEESRLGDSQELGSEWLFRVSPEYMSKDGVHWRYHPVDERAGL